MILISVQFAVNFSRKLSLRAIHLCRSSEKRAQKSSSFPGKSENKFAQKFHMMTRHYLDLGSVCYRLKQISHTARPIGSTTQLWVSDTSLVWNCWAHFAQKLVVTKWNASCFFRLNNLRSLIWFSFVTLWNWKISINSLPKSKILNVI